MLLLTRSRVFMKSSKMEVDADMISHENNGSGRSCIDARMVNSKNVGSELHLLK